jgi:hypothetical protein
MQLGYDEGSDQPGQTLMDYAPLLLSISPFHGRFSSKVDAWDG